MAAGEPNPDLEVDRLEIWRAIDESYVSQSDLDRANGGGCVSVREGDCEHVIGLPGKSIPGQHDGADDTVDEYGKPNGWCWSCWKSHQIDELRKEVQVDTVRHYDLRKEVQALQGWQDVAAESNRDVSAYLQGEFPSLDLEGGMPIGNIRKVVDYLTSLKCPPALEEHLSASEAVYGFCGWLTTQESPTVMSRTHDAGRIAKLVDTFCKQNKLSEPRAHWEKQLEHPNSIEPKKTESNAYLLGDLTVYFGWCVNQAEEALALLSGDINHNNVAEAKKMLKNVIDQAKVIG